MGWLDKLIDMVAGGLPSAANALCPEHVKKRWLERLGDHNPFKTISANHDLIRVTRLAWIEATQDIVKEARKQADTATWRRQAADIRAFDATITDILLDTRDHALDRRKHPGTMAIDAHVQAIIAGVPELVAPGDHTGIGDTVTSAFTATLAALSGWEAREIPAIYGQIAATGLATHGGGPARPFGELVFAAFAEVLKDPDKYPQAREAFRIAMDKLARDLGEATLAAVRGLDGKLDRLTVSLDGLEVLRTGAMRYLELLPDIASGVASANDKLDELLRRTAQSESVPIEILRAILAGMGETASTLDAGQIGERLKAKASEFRELSDRLNRLSNDDPEVQRLRRAAAEALAQGRFAQVDADLAAAEARDLAGLEDVEALATKKRLSAAESRAERGAAAKLRTTPDAYREAASHFGEAARIAESADAKVARGYLRRQGGVLIDLGDEFGRNEVLLEAIGHFQGMLSGDIRREDPDDWAKTQNNLGSALASLGGRERGMERLQAAVDAFRAALEAYTRERVPLDWAMTQINLGTALVSLGQRESGTERLQTAVSVYRAALEEYTREHVPLDWAMTQANLGNALFALGERESGTERLEAAITAYRAALEEWTRERAPLEWARTQTNLGSALQTLGERESGTARLEEAVTTYRLVLEERTHERVPLEWATTQNNLGSALWRLGKRESGTVRLEEAVAAYRAALEECTRERVPLDWATTQNNLGSALQTLGARESGTARLEEAVAAFRAALEEGTRERVPLDWATTQNNLGNALQTLGERESGTARLEEAVTAYRSALEERTRKRVPLQWAGTQNNLGSALWRLGERESGTECLNAAVDAFRAALEEWTRERVPLDWAGTQDNLGSALLRLGARESGTARLEEAVAAYRAALEERTRERVPLDWALTQNNLGIALSMLGERESGTARLEEAVASYREALKERTRERVPPGWAATLGNEGSALRLIAERKSDPALAERALAQIETARQEFRAAGHAHYEAILSQQADLARALIDRLKARP